MSHVALASSDERRVALVTGATGCIGNALAARLVKSGDYDEVRALVRAKRDGSRIGNVPSGVRCVAGTLDNTAALQTAVENASVVFHCAAKVHDANGNPDEFFRVNVDGTKNLLDACAAQNASPPRFVFFSTVAVYGDATPPEGIAENALPTPQTPYAESKRQAETWVAGWGEAHRTPVYNLRVATVYGPRDRGNLGRMMDAISRNRFLLIGDGQNRKTCVAVQNAVHAAIALASQEKYADSTPVIVSDPHWYTLRELRDAMQTALCQAQDQAAPSQKGGQTLPLPAAVLLAGAATGAARLLGKKSPLTPEQARKIAQSNVYIGERLQQIDGYTPEVSLSQGMADAARWLLQSRHESEAK